MAAKSEKNKIKKAIFSKDGAIGLLDKYDIKINSWVFQHLSKAYLAVNTKVRSFIEVNRFYAVPKYQAY